MVVDFEGQAPNGDIMLEQTTKYKARNLLRIVPGDINHLPYFGFNLDYFNGQSNSALKLSISRYLLSYHIELENITMDNQNTLGVFKITQNIKSAPYLTGYKKEKIYGL